MPQTIYEAYPDHDVLLIEPPKQGETIGEFAYRAENAGDTLFLFLCREADDEIDAHVYMARLNRAIGDINAVKAAVQGSLRSSPDGQPVTIRIPLDGDWIELAITCANAQGRRAGSVSSSLHSSETEDDHFNAAVDAIESMVLAHACAGIDVTDSKYVEGIRTCVECCTNNL
jgi:hypothetical protein